MTLIEELHTRCSRVMFIPTPTFGVLHSDFPDLELPNQNVWQYLYPRIKQWGELTAFIMSDSEESLTYNELIAKSLSWAKEVKKYFKGSKPPTVSFTTPNNIDCFPLIIGTLAIGAPICPIREDLNQELFTLMVSQTKPDVMVFDSEAYEKFKETLTKTGIQTNVYIRGQSPIKPGLKDFRQVLNSGDQLDIAEAGQFEITSVAAMIYSSGTTGTPKGSVISHKALVNSIFLISHREFQTITPSDEGEQETIVGSLPLSHISGLEYFTLTAASIGCRVVYMDCQTTDQLLYIVKKYKPVLVRLLNNILEELSNLDDLEPYRCLKSIVFVGCPANVNAFNKLNAKLGNKLFFQNCYASTEGNVVTCMPRRGHRPETAGKLLANCKLKLVDLNSEKLVTEPNQIGVILSKTHGHMDGYLNNPDATREVIDSEGWFHSGDVGYFDEDHFITVVERQIDLITVNVGDLKIKVSPSEIEKVILLHPEVSDVGVIGIPNLTTAQEVIRAFVISKRQIDTMEIIKFVEDRVTVEMRLSGGVVFVNELPKNPMGKLIRKYLRASAWVN